MKYPKQASILILLLAATPPGWSESNRLGRLFFTPEKRLALDRQSLPGTAADMSTFTINGNVHRSSGHHTIWVNGQPMGEESSLPFNAAKFKVGETIDPATGKHTDLLRGGTVARFRPIPPLLRRP